MNCRAHPTQASIHIPSRDGSLLRATIIKDEAAGKFTRESPLTFTETTPHGDRPLVAYRTMSLLDAHRDTFGLHDKEPGLTIDGGWLTHLQDWIEMMIGPDNNPWKEES